MLGHHPFTPCLVGYRVLTRDLKPLAADRDLSLVLPMIGMCVPGISESADSGAK
jgi:hypothetical protein